MAFGCVKMAARSRDDVPPSCRISRERKTSIHHNEEEAGCEYSNAHLCIQTTTHLSAAAGIARGRGDLDLRAPLHAAYLDHIAAVCISGLNPSTSPTLSLVLAAASVPLLSLRALRSSFSAPSPTISSSCGPHRARSLALT
ncbi:uncharacterized protein V6R79_002706 [Siganus canaliculatus]